MKDFSRDGKNILSNILGFLEQWKLMKPLELGLLVLLCFIAGRILSYNLQWGNDVFSGFWMILVALLVSKEAVMRLDEMQWPLMAVAIGVAGGYLMVSIFGLNAISLFIAVVLIAAICAHFRWGEYQQLAILSLIVLVVSNYLVINMALWAGAIGRILEAAIGMLLTIGVRSLFIWINDSRDVPPISNSTNTRY